MESCWRVLGISPTADAASVRAAYHKLILQHHPDRGRTPEAVRKRTVRCARVNAAYTEARAIASQMHANQQPNYQEEPSGIRIRRARARPRAEPPRTATLPQPMWRSISTVIGSLLGLTIGLSIVAFLFFAADGIRTLAPFHPIRIAFMTTITAGVGLLVGVLVVGLIDAFIILGVLQLIFSRLHLEKYEAKIAWLLIVALNVVLVTAGPFSLAFSESIDPLDWFYGAVFKALIAGTVPMGLAWDWIATRMRYRRAQRGGAAIPNIDSISMET